MDRYYFTSKQIDRESQLRRVVLVVKHFKGNRYKLDEPEKQYKTKGSSNVLDFLAHIWQEMGSRITCSWITKVVSTVDISIPGDWSGSSSGAVCRGKTHILALLSSGEQRIC